MVTSGKLNNLVAGLIALGTPVMFLLTIGGVRLNVSIADGLIAGTFLIVLWSVVINQEDFQASKTIVYAVLLLVWGVISVALAFLRYDLEALSSVVEWFKYLTDFIWFFTLTFLLKNKAAFGWFLRSWAGIAVIISGYVIAAHFLDPETTVRATGTFQNPNALAHYLGSSLAVVWFLAKGKRGLLFSGFGLLMYALLLTASRGGLLASLIVLSWIFFWEMIDGDRKSRLFQWGLFFTILLLLLAFSQGGHVVVHRSVQDGSLTNIADRVSIWSDSVELTKIHPIVGAGLGMFPLSRLNHFKRTPTVTHNEYLGFLAEQGIIGFIILVTIIVHSVKASISLSRRSSIGVVCGAVILQTVFQGLVANVFQLRMFWIGLSLLVVASVHGLRAKSFNH